MSRLSESSRRAVRVHGLSASVPMRTVSASVLALVAGAAAALAQAQPHTGPGTAPAPIIAAPPPPAGSAAGTSGAVTGVTGESQHVLSPTRGFPDAQPPTGAKQSTSEPKEDSQVKVDDNLVVDLHVNDEELANVLQMLSIQSQRNIVASNSVNARVKADLYGVTFYEALDAILHVNGYGYIDRGNFIYVYTLEELQQIEKAARTRISKVIKLNYLNAIDAAEFVKPLLSDGAQIKTNGKTKDFTINNVPMGADEFAHDATLVVYDYEENLAEIEKLVRELDTRPAQVLIEATILQTQLNEANAFGVDFSLIADLNFTDFATLGGPESAVNNLISGKVAPPDDVGRALVSTPGNTSGRGTMKVGIIANDVAAFVKLLDETSDTTIISNPKVLALNRAQTRVLVGRKVGYLSTTSTDTTTTQSVEFLDTGTQLTVRPFVSADGMIRMELKPQVSEAVIRDTKDATGAAVTIPDEITNELNTNVMVRDGQTIVLGGLFRESTQATRRQVPFLGDIPLLGSAFRGNDDETNRSEIIFLITPSIVNDNVLLSQGEAAKDYVERARAGSREGLLPWSRDKMTSMDLVEAQKLAAAGETQKALWKVQQSLTLNPMQPDAIAMREKLTNEKDLWPSRNLLDMIIHQEAAIKIGKPKASAEPLAPAPIVIAPPVPPAPPAPAPATPAPEVPAPVASAPLTDATLPTNDPVDAPQETPAAEPQTAPESPAPMPGVEPVPQPIPEPEPQQPNNTLGAATWEVSPRGPFPASNGRTADGVTASDVVNASHGSAPSSLEANGETTAVVVAQDLHAAVTATSVSTPPIELIGTEEPAGESAAMIGDRGADQTSDNLGGNVSGTPAAIAPELERLEAVPQTIPTTSGSVNTSSEPSLSAIDLIESPETAGAVDREQINESVHPANNVGTPESAEASITNGASLHGNVPQAPESQAFNTLKEHSAGSSTLSQNSTSAPSDYSRVAEAGVQETLPSTTATDASFAATGSQSAPWQGSPAPPQPSGDQISGTGFTNLQGKQRVSVALRFMNRSWRMLSVFQAGGSSAGVLTSAPDESPPGTER